VPSVSTTRDVRHPPGILRLRECVVPAPQRLSSATIQRGARVELLTEQEYRDLQERGEFDLKTSSWIKTPLEIRNLGGALFCDRRYNTVFTYHNGAESYYAARGFRGSLRV
jgi:hypothetical protein